MTDLMTDRAIEADTGRASERFSDARQGLIENL
jgi:hypothetical protein